MKWNFDKLKYAQIGCFKVVICQIFIQIVILMFINSLIVKFTLFSDS